MLKPLLTAMAFVSIAPAALAATGQMRLAVVGARDGARAPTPMVFCTPAASGHVRLGPNISPALLWSAPPGGTRSLAILMFDDDVPADATDVNKEGRTIKASSPRRRFYHWVLAELPAGLRELRAGAGGSGVSPHGRQSVGGPGRAGVNDYTGFFSGDAAMAGTYRGYDGPCPPWNDQRMHRYVIRLLALDTDNLRLGADFTGDQFERATAGHVLSSSSVTLTFATSQPANRRASGRR